MYLKAKKSPHTTQAFNLKYLSIIFFYEERETENNSWNRTENLVIKPIHEKLKKTEWTSEMIQR